MTVKIGMRSVEQAWDRYAYVTLPEGFHERMVARGERLIHSDSAQGQEREDAEWMGRVYGELEAAQQVEERLKTLFQQTDMTEMPCWVNDQPELAPSLILEQIDAWSPDDIASRTTSALGRLIKYGIEPNADSPDEQERIDALVLASFRRHLNVSSP